MAEQSLKSQERRVLERDTCEVGAFVQLSTGETLACTVKDLSPAGARVVLAAPLPEVAACTLSIPAVPGAHQSFAARIAWHDGLEVGLEFT